MDLNQILYDFQFTKFFSIVKKHKTAYSFLDYFEFLSHLTQESQKQQNNKQFIAEQKFEVRLDITSFIF